MFLKRLKDRSNRKYINKILNSRDGAINDYTIKSVGVVINTNEFDNYNKIKNIFKHIGINKEKVKFIAFIDNIKPEIEAELVLNSKYPHFSPKNFGWNGKINNVEVQKFINMEFDVLLSYYKRDDLELNMVTALSKANFKIGISRKDERLNDFIIDVEPNQIIVFRKQLIKYLKVFNKI